MAVQFFLAFFVLSHLVLLHSVSVQKDNNIQINCPKSFDCTNFGPLKFPFANSTMYSQCGLCTVTCGEWVPQILLGRYESHLDFYEVKEIISQDDKIQVQIQDARIQSYLDSRNCLVFSNLTFPNSPSISFTISQNLTFFKCNKSSELSSHKHDSFDGFHNYTICDGQYSLYYKYPDDQNSAPSDHDLPINCSVIQLPVKSSNLQPNAYDPFELLAAKYILELHVSEDCLNCHQRGGQCQNDNQTFHCTAKEGGQRQNDNQTFHCTAKKGGTNLRLILLGTVIPGGVILIICLLTFIMPCRNYVSSYFLSRNTSSDPSSRAEVEGRIVFFGVSVFSYSELQEATNNFHPSKELGDGGFGTVYHGKLQDGREVAVKRLYEQNYKQVRQFMNEVEILTRLRHHNLVSLYGCTSRHSRELLLVYEYIPNGTVADHLHGNRAKDGSLTWPIRMKIAIETATALAYLHASDIIHRDVKTNNILLDNNFGVKVADFGLSRLFPTDVSHVSTAPQGTPGYVDPEYHQCYQLTDKSDVYSFGVVLIELISSMPAVDISRHRHEINLANLAINRIHNRAMNELIDPSLGFESDSSIERMITSVAEVAFQCLQLEKEMRPTMNEALEALKGIQEYKDENIGEETDNVGMLKCTRSPRSPEGDYVVLKNSKVPPSPHSVTERWVSSSTTFTSSV